METTLIPALTASLLACLVTSIGILAISRYGQKSREYSPYFVCFAAGVLISVSFLHIIPVSVVLSFPFIRGLQGAPPGALLAVIAGALVYVGATHLLPEVKNQARKSTLLAMAAGVAIAVVIVAVEA